MGDLEEESTGYSHKWENPNEFAWPSFVLNASDFFLKKRLAM